MKFSIRFRTLTAYLLLICVVINLCWLPGQLSIADFRLVFDSPLNAMVLGRAHVGLSLICFGVAIVLGIFHLFFPTYRRDIAIVTLLVCVLLLIFAFSFQFSYPAVWLLPVWSSWRLTGKKIAFRR